MEHHWPAILRHDAFDEDVVVVRMNIPEQSSDLFSMLAAVIRGNRDARRAQARMVSIAPRNMDISAPSRSAFK